MLGARALCLQELRWPCCRLRPGLSMWQTSPRTCQPLIQGQAELGSGRIPPGNEPRDDIPDPLGFLHVVRSSPPPGPVCPRFSAQPLHIPVVLPCAGTDNVHHGQTCPHSVCTDSGLHSFPWITPQVPLSVSAQLDQLSALISFQAVVWSGPRCLSL